jgi:plastocyanin
MRNAGAKSGARRRRLWPWLLVLTPHADATSLTVRLEEGGIAVTDAVVSLHSPAAERAARAGTADLDQRDSQFAPHVLPITVGTAVGFPNSDRVRHHVYSFSPIKRFELPLFSGRAAAPVTFGQAGVATLGCNIHDWMIAYVVVLDTPYFGRSDADGRATIDAPPGEYRLRIWHERLRPAEPVPEREIRLGAAEASETVNLQLAPRALPARGGPGAGARMPPLPVDPHER